VATSQAARRSAAIFGRAIAMTADAEGIMLPGLLLELLLDPDLWICQILDFIRVFRMPDFSQPMM
jgi:hypothetical protein